MPGLVKRLVAISVEPPRHAAVSSKIIRPNLGPTKLYMSAKLMPPARSGVPDSKQQNFAKPQPSSRLLFAKFQEKSAKVCGDAFRPLRTSYLLSRLRPERSYQAIIPTAVC